MGRNSDSPPTLEELEGDLCEILMYGDPGLPTPEAFRDCIALYLADGARMESLGGEDFSLAYHALYAAIPEALRGMALAGFDWAGSRGAHGQNALHHALATRMLRADASEGTPAQRSLITQRRVECIEALTSFGVDPAALAPCPRLGLGPSTPLHCAAAIDEPGGIPALEAAGANLLALDWSGRTACETAIAQGAPHFLGAWIGRGLPIPSAERIEILLASDERAQAGLPLDEGGLALCRQLLGSILLASEMDTECPPGSQGTPSPSL